MGFSWDKPSTNWRCKTFFHGNWQYQWFIPVDFFLVLVFIVLLGISSIECRDIHRMSSCLYAFFLSFFWARVSPPFYRDFGGCQISTLYIVMLTWGDSHVQCHGFPSYRDHILWKTAISNIIGSSFTERVGREECKEGSGDNFKISVFQSISFLYHFKTVHTLVPWGPPFCS